MTNDELQQRSSGRRLLHAVERLVDDSDEIITRVETLKQQLAVEHGRPVSRERVAERIIARYSNRAAISGGVTALLALLPGVGTVLAVVGGTLADLVLTLKFQVEMTLSLSYLYGHDIRDRRERRLAYLLASLSTDEAARGVGLARAQADAVWTYAPWQTGKSLLMVMGRLASRSARRGLFKALPVVGAVASASANKVLTVSVGLRCVRALARRRAQNVGRGAAEPVVDARLDAHLDVE